MPRFGVMVFDLDGVLADSSGCHARAFEELWTGVGVEGPPYPQIAGRPTEAVVREWTARLGPTEDQIAAWVRFKQERARQYLRHDSAPFPDVAPALQRLQRVPVRLAIGTGASLPTTRVLLERLGLGDLFPVIVTAEDVTAGKPAPDTFALAIVRSGGAPEETLVVEDSRAGLEAGTAAGAYVASVRCGERVEHPRFLGCFADLTVLLDELGIASR